jgi:hypothetical protein
MKTVMSAFAACLVLIISSAARAAGAPLADRIPADAMIYFGWAGADRAPGYDGSHFKAVIDASDLPKLFDKVVPMALEKLGENDRDAAKIAHQAVDLVGPMWHHPTALYFGGVELNGPPMPKLAIICDAGADAAAMTDQISALLDQARDAAGPGMPAITAKHYDSLVVVAFGAEPAVDAMFAKPPVDSLDKSPRFIEALKQVNPNPTLAVYVDAEALVAAVDNAMGKMADAKMMDRWTHIKTSLGLGQFKRMVAACGFDGADWVDEQFVSTSGTDGLAGMFDAKPLDPAVLAAIPKTADRMGAFQFDLGNMVAQLRKAASDLDPQIAEKVDEAVSQVNEQAGMDVQKDLLDHLGSQWADYTDRATGGGGLAGIVVVNRLKDPEAFDAGATRLSGRLNRIIAKAMDNPDIKLEFKSEVVDGVTLHYFAIPLITPTWAVKDGNLYIGLYPQVVSSAAAYVTAKGPSITERPEFIAVMKRLGNKPASSVDFVDLPATAADSYGTILGASRWLLGMSDLFGMTTPAMTIPPLRKILPELSPSGGVSWTDQAGWHYKAVSPFPGSSLFASAGMLSGGVGVEAAMVGAVLYPAVGKARESANAVKGLSDLHQIGLASMMYCVDHRGQYPDDLGQTVKYLGGSAATAAIFLTPGSDLKVPANWADLSEAEKSAWVNDHSQMEYLGKGLKSGELNGVRRSADRTVLAYQKLETARRGRVGVLYADGHCSLESVEQVKAEIANRH